MKKADIIFLKRQNIDQVTNHTLPVEHAYKVVKLRRAINDAYDSILKDEDACREAAEIKDGRAFDKELFELRNNTARTKEQDDRLNEMEAKLQRFIDLKEEMKKQDIAIDGTKTMPYEMWHKLQCENSDKDLGGRKVDLLAGPVEDLLEGLLWEAPKE